jgi:hypothetical protein
MVIMNPVPAIDLAHRLLHRLGRSGGEARFQMPSGSRYWQVDASRGELVVIATAYSQAMAWWEPCPECNP